MRLKPTAIYYIFYTFNTSKNFIYSDNYINFESYLTSDDIYGFGERIHNFKLSEGIYTLWPTDRVNLYDEGIRGLIFDIDNTLVPHDAPCNDKSDALVRKLMDMGFKVFLLSNNKEARVELFTANIPMDSIHLADKPKKDNYFKALDMMGLDKSQVVAIGDQLFTDCLGAKNAGIKFILVGILDKKEPPRIKLKRILEKPIYLLTGGKKK